MPIYEDLDHRGRRIYRALRTPIASTAAELLAPANHIAEHPSRRVVELMAIIDHAGTIERMARLASLVAWLLSHGTAGTEP